MEIIRRLVTLDVNQSHVQLLPGVLAIIGIVVLLLQHSSNPLGRSAAFLAGVGVLALLFSSLMLSGAVWQLLRTLTIPWYRSWWRLPYNLALLAPVFAGIALERARELLTERTNLARRPALAGVAVAVLFAGLTVPAAKATLDSAQVRDEMLSRGGREMLISLADATRTSPSSEPIVVLNQENDATAWMYIREGIPSFSAFGGLDARPESTAREWLLENARLGTSNPKVAELLRKWNVRYALVSDRPYQDYPAALNPAELAKAHGFEVIAHQDDLWLFEITLRPTGGGSG